MLSDIQNISKGGMAGIGPPGPVLEGNLGSEGSSKGWKVGATLKSTHMC